ncbi:unnamed protein product [Symbiodinium natans]|uniref:Uncharacterized protein n=1 Tax=Symbiodinium natans TaxID=878477 RepID=A0A812THD5_9DINO|nr:unnamed protein product [Symbiodinium natans]
MHILSYRGPLDEYGSHIELPRGEPVDPLDGQELALGELLAGDPLAPALFALGQHAALCQARDTVVQAVQEGCGIASNDGKTRAYCHAGGAPPPGMAELGADAWRGNKAPSERGLVVLGTPISHPHFIASWAESRMRTEQKLLSQLPRLPDLQCAWRLLAMCASPRANHTLRTAQRTVPPLDIAGYAQAHDDAVWQTLQACLGGVASGSAGARQSPAGTASCGHIRLDKTVVGGSGCSAVTSTALGSPRPAPPHAGQLDQVLDLADTAGPSRLPLR